jgi:hypothetical protein
VSERKISPEGLFIYSKISPNHSCRVPNSLRDVRKWEKNERERKDKTCSFLDTSFFFEGQETRQKERERERKRERKKRGMPITTPTHSPPVLGTGIGKTKQTRICLSLVPFSPPFFLVPLSSPLPHTKVNQSVSPDDSLTFSRGTVSAGSETTRDFSDQKRGRFEKMERGEEDPRRRQGD